MWLSHKKKTRSWRQFQALVPYLLWQRWTISTVEAGHWTSKSDALPSGLATNASIDEQQPRSWKGCWKEGSKKKKKAKEMFGGSKTSSIGVWMYRVGDIGGEQLHLLAIFEVYNSCFYVVQTIYCQVQQRALPWKNVGPKKST